MVSHTVYNLYLTKHEILVGTVFFIVLLFHCISLILLCFCLYSCTCPHGCAQHFGQLCCF